MKLRTLFFRFFNEILITTLIFYFIFHACVVHYGSVPLTEILVLFLVLLVISLLLKVLFGRCFHSQSRSTIYVFVFMVMILFYGVFQNVLEDIRPIAELGRISYLTPICFLILIILFIYLRRSTSSFVRARKFLAVLLCLYLIVDLYQLGKNIFESRQGNSGMSGRSNVRKLHDPVTLPSIYLILLDEYSGNESLAEYFNYPNSRFKKFLTDNDFYIVKNPTSNYNLTIFSMASLLDMDFINDIGSATWLNHYGYKKALQTIDNNKTCRLLKEFGYKIRNKSPFYVDGLPPAYNPGWFPDKINLVQHQTMYYKIAKALPDLLLGKFDIQNLEQRHSDFTDDYNHRVLKEVLDETNLTDSIPTFTYAHLMMPHEPYLRDSSGNVVPPYERGVEIVQRQEDSSYFQYLIYTNNIIAEFITSLKQKTGGKAVILLISDHGFKSVAKKKQKYGYNNLHALYLPSRKYSGWYPGISNVNAFPQLFNTVFGTKMQLRKDSIIQ